MSLNAMSNISNSKSSLCPTNGRLVVGDGASNIDSHVIAVCHAEDNKYYYSTTFSGGPEVSDICGGFDVPKQKCPPDRGSSECVTGIPAPKNGSAFHYFANQHRYPSKSISPPFLQPVSIAAAPRAIPSRSASSSSTPPLSPDSGSESSVDSSSSHSIYDKSPRDALDFLITLFPRNGISALSHATNVSICSEQIGRTFDGVVLELPGKPRTLYVDGKSAESVSLRESVVALLDLADEKLNCSALVIVLQRSSPILGELLHSLMYVGGTVVTKPPFQVNPAFVLVGLEM
ncbi:ornithine decarboxylase antizyme-domain-containing protein [Mycena floridula]|nr:ornithine decarboxylase antizyme-domain-containing protein [Mycena floridula]